MHRILHGELNLIGQLPKSRKCWTGALSYYGDSHRCASMTVPGIEPSALRPRNGSLTFTLPYWQPMIYTFNLNQFAKLYHHYLTSLLGNYLTLFTVEFHWSRFFVRTPRITSCIYSLWEKTSFRT